MTWAIGVDQGSHSSRAAVFDETGELVNKISQSVDLVRNGVCAEHDALQLLSSVKQVIRQLLATLDVEQVNKISACGIATQRSTVLAWDAAGNALSQALSWQDTRASADIEPLTDKEQVIKLITGLPLAPYYSAGKMHWLLQHEPSVIDHENKGLRLSPLVSYLLFNLVSEKPFVIDHSNAQRTQLFDLSALDWSEQLCTLFGIRQCYLPACKPMCSHYGTLAETGIPVMAVCGDQNAAFFGLGDLTADTALVNIGSGAFVLRTLQNYQHSTTQLTGIACSDGETVRYMREATINGAGNALTWVKDELGIDHNPALLAQWLNEIMVPPVFINTVGGLGTPWMREGISPAFIGAGNSSAAEKCVAILESIVFLVQVNLDLMHEESPLSKLRVSGGLSRLDGLCQKLSSLSGLTVERTETVEASARGVAWLAAGCPDSWTGNACQSVDLYLPQSDTGLEQRYRVFQQELSTLLEL